MKQGPSALLRLPTLDYDNCVVVPCFCSITSPKFDRPYAALHATEDGEIEKYLQNLGSDRKRPTVTILSQRRTGLRYQLRRADLLKSEFQHMFQSTCVQCLVSMGCESKVWSIICRASF